MPSHSMLHSKLFEHSKKQKLVKAFNKAVKKLSSINVHFVMHGQSDSEESFSSVTSSAHGALDKSSNLENFYRAKSKVNALTDFLKNIECYQKGTLTNIQWKK